MCESVFVSQADVQGTLTELLSEHQERLTAELNGCSLTDHRPELITGHTRIVPSMLALVWEADDQVSAHQAVVIVNDDFCVVQFPPENQTHTHSNVQLYTNISSTQT